MRPESWLSAPFWACSPAQWPRRGGSTGEPAAGTSSAQRCVLTSNSWTSPKCFQVPSVQEPPPTTTNLVELSAVAVCEHRGDGGVPRAAQGSQRFSQEPNPSSDECAELTSCYALAPRPLVVSSLVPAMGLHCQGLLLQEAPCQHVCQSRTCSARLRTALLL